MFYCEECRKKNGWPEALFSRSHGPCEMCKITSLCHDVHHSRLPAAKKNEGEPLSFTLALIKPDAVMSKQVGAIIAEMEKKFLLADIFQAKWEEEHVRRFYQEHEQKSFFPDLVRFMTRSRIYAITLVAPDAVAKWRGLMGATDPMKAEPDTIRGRFAAKDGIVMHNVVHGSDSADNAYLEIAFLQKWVQQTAPRQRFGEAAAYITQNNQWR